MGILDFSLDDFNEVFDTRLLIPILGIAAVWLIIDSLMVITNYISVVQIWIYGFMILFSIGFLLFLGIKADFKESLELEKVMIGFLVALLGVYLVSIFVAVTMNPGQLSILNILTMLKVAPFSLPSDPQALTQPVLIRFVNFAQTFNFSPNTLYSVLTHVFLVSPGEELLFRGVGTFVATKAFEPITGPNAKGGVFVGGVASTIIWAIIHTIANQSYMDASMIISVLIAFCGGLFFLIAMIYSKNIYAAIAAHATYNAVCVIATALMTGV